LDNEEIAINPIVSYFGMELSTINTLFGRVDLTSYHPLAFVPMSAKNLQNKIFGTPSSSSSALKPSPSDPGLTINIPKQQPAALNVSHTQHPKPGPTTPVTKGDKESAISPKKYRDKVAIELGSEYESVERYRLLQDERKDRHWKKWGPYLAERQWACLN
jgi:hypothetical protein